MLPKTARLNLSQEFKKVASGKRLETPNLVIFRKEDLNELPLVGIAVSKKTLSLAVARNRAKRLVAVAVYAIYPTLPKNLKLVIMPKASVLKCSSAQLEEELSQALNV